MDDAASQSRPQRLMSPLLGSQVRLLWRRGAVLLAVCGLLVAAGTWASVAISPLYVLQLGLPLVAAWASTGVIVDDVALEMVGASQTPVRLLWLIRVWLVLLPVLALALVWLIALDQSAIVIAYTLLLIVAAMGWAQAVARWRASAMIGNIAVSSVLLSQYAAPLLWLPNAGWLWADADRWLKVHLFFPMDADPMYAILHADRPTSAMLIGSLGCVAWLWCFTNYRFMENLILPHDE